MCMSDPESMPYLELRKLIKQSGGTSWRDLIPAQTSVKSLGKQAMATRVEACSSKLYREHAQRESATRGRKVGPEELFQRDYDTLARDHGVHYHTYNSKYSAPGFLDNVTIGKLLVVSELKVKPNKATPAQKAWLEAWRTWFVSAGVSADHAVVGLWYPEDWLEILEVFHVRG